MLCSSTEAEAAFWAAAGWLGMFVLLAREELAARGWADDPDLAEVPALGGMPLLPGLLARPALAAEAGFELGGWALDSWPEGAAAPREVPGLLDVLCWLLAPELLALAGKAGIDAIAAGQGLAGAELCRGRTAAAV